MCFPTESSTCAKMSVHIIFLFCHLRFWSAPKHATQHFSSHDLWPNGYYHNCMFSVAIKKYKKINFSQKRLTAINAFAICWGSCKQRFQIRPEWKQDSSSTSKSFSFNQITILQNNLSFQVDSSCLLECTSRTQFFSRPKTFDKDLPKLPGPSQKEGDISWEVPYSASYQDI